MMITVTATVTDAMQKCSAGPEVLYLTCNLKGYHRVYNITAGLSPA